MENGPETNKDAELYDAEKAGSAKYSIQIDFSQVKKIPNFAETRSRYPELCEEECLWIFEGEMSDYRASKEEGSNEGNN